MTENKKRLIVVAGPTAIGKSRLAIELAKRLDGEVVSCDSMQIYRGMDIGTAKVTPKEACGIPHHMIDIIDPNEPFSCADFAMRAISVTDGIFERGRLPIVCGGTGLYADSLLYRSYESPPCDEKLRERLMQNDPALNYARLREIDPESAEKIHQNNIKRVVRALEIYDCSGLNKSEWDRRQQHKESRYITLGYALLPKDREALYSRVNERVDEMMERGLLEEVRVLLPLFSKESTASQAIGYKELAEHLRGEITLEEAVEKVKKASRNYVKRQITWFVSHSDMKKIYVENSEDILSAADMIAEEYQRIS